MSVRVRIVATVGALLLSAAACSSGGSTNLEANKELILRVHRDLWSEGNLEILDDLIGPDFIGHAPSGADWIGSEGLRERIVAHRATFPDWTEEVNVLVAEDDLVAVRFTSTGTDEGGFRGNTATGRRIEIREQAIYRIAKGKVVEQWVLPDLLGLQQQLGQVPVPPNG
jgi:predicted ester cyclase